VIEQKNLFDKYLHLLGVKKSQPSFDLLCQIVKAHLIKIPFENISKLLYKKQGVYYTPDLSAYLDGIEKYNFGGTCYANNYYLYLLLKHLGYNIKLCGADMKNPDVHLISIITIDGREFIVDCGYAAPFFEPIPLDSDKDFEISLGYEKYLVKPKDKFGRIKVEQYFKDELQHWYVAKPEERKIEDFRGVIEESYSDGAVFMNAVRITKFLENGSLVLKNLSLSEIRGNKSSSKKISRDEMPLVIQENFGIPLSVVKEAISIISELNDIYD
jgi:arylamine N-acetyltransferase